MITMITRSFLIVNIYIILCVYCAYACHTFYNTTISMRLFNHTYFRDVKVTGCIDRTSLGDKHPEEIRLTHQFIPKLGKDDFRNLGRLKILKIENCNITAIHPETFRNVPRLQEIYINDNAIEAVPADAFLRGMSLEVLMLNNNRISQIAGFQNMDRLNKLKLRRNQIASIDSEWFANCSALRILDLSYNRIGELTDRTFRHIRRVKQLHLDDNQIALIKPKTFEKLKDLKVLGLRHNRLKDIRSDIFGSSKLDMDQLIFSANQLNYLGKDVMEKLKVRIFKIDGNPIKCNCLDEVAKWLKLTGGSFLTSTGCEDLTDMPVCVYPKILSVECVESVDDFSVRKFFEVANKIIDDKHLSCANLDLVS